MKVTYNWLKDFADIAVSPEELADKLTKCGMEVEEIEYQNEHLHDVVVGKILKIEKHPEADRLVVCQVDIAERVVQIVTAATNVFEGALVPVSLPGADLCNGIKIEKSKLRGVESEGMFCSGEELGIDENYFEGAGVNGILILPKDTQIGQKIEDALCLNDVVYDVNVTPNRPDCMSVVGIAREVCALLGTPFKMVSTKYNATYEDNISKYIDVEVKTPNCKRYMAVAVKDVQIKKSPLWVRKRLFAVGVKPINTIVDITNYVLIEMGQPLHAFDQSLIGGSKIVVRQAKEGEQIAVLNGNTYTLDEETMVIADAEKPMVMAGIIGGINSCIQDDTKTVVFESAVFDLKNIRVSDKKYGLRTDSSARYEKGVNVANAELGLSRALNLLDALGCGTIVSGIIDKASEKNDERTILGSVKAIYKILGVEVPVQRMEEILNNLQIKTYIEGDKIIATVPPYREDIVNNNDLAEEIIRMYGYDVYDNKDLRLFANATITEGKLPNRLVMENKFKQVLVDNGFFETVNFSICPPDIAEKLLIKDERVNHIKIANPISEEISCLRTTMAHSILVDVAYNKSVGNADLRLFEVGRTYQPVSENLADLPKETNYVSFAVCEKGFDFFKLKGVILAMLCETSVSYKIQTSSAPYLHPGISADFVNEKGEVFASFGKIHPIVQKNYDIKDDVYYAEINMDLIGDFVDKVVKVKPVSKFPIVERDIAIVVAEEKTNEELSSVIKSACGNLFYSVELFDIYRSEAIGKEMKSMAYNIKLSDPAKTLTEQDVQAVINKVLKALEFRCGAHLR